jgi:iron complex outermembrane receptor protein
MQFNMVKQILRSKFVSSAELSHKPDQPIGYLNNTIKLLSLVLLVLTTNAFAQTSVDSIALKDMKKLSLEDLMNIEVTSVSKRPEKLTEVASAIQVITGEDIRRSGVTTLPEALRLAQNLQVAQVNSSQWAISARGFNNVLADKLLVMIDGRTVYTPLYAGVFWDVQNVLLEDVDRIEVISGPGGTLWGANAVNGVINIITKNSKYTEGLYIQAGTGLPLQPGADTLIKAGSGKQLPWSGDLRYGGNIGENIHYRIFGTAFKKASTRLLNGDDAQDSWSMGKCGFRFDWDASKKDEVTLQSNYYNGSPNPDGTTAVEATGGNILAGWTHTISDKSDFYIQAYFDQTWRDFHNRFTEMLKTYDLDWQYRFQLCKRHEIIWGGDIRLMEHHTNNLALFRFDPNYRVLHIYSTFVQDKITLIKERLHFTIGSKFEHNSYTGMEYSPSGRLAWTPGGNQTIWAAVSRAVRTPSRIERDFYLDLMPNFPIITSSDFKSVTVWAYELGWRIQPFTKLSLAISSFYNVYDNIRTAEPAPTSLYPFSMGNGINGFTYGAEFSSTYQITHWWRIKGGYTYLKKELSVKPDSKDLNKGTAESDDPMNQFMLRSMFDIFHQFEGGFVIRYVDSLLNKKVPNYVGLDIQLGWKITKKIEFSVIGQNLLDDSHLEFIPSSPSPREISRNIYAKITCKF